MTSASTQLKNLISLVRGRPAKRGRKSSKGSMIGSQDQILTGGIAKRKILTQLDLNENPLRPIMMSHQTSRSLLEMCSWSPEFSTCLRLLSQNIFQDEDGSVHSWKLKIDKKNPENNPDSYIVGLVRDLSNRYYGRDEILGGQILEPAVRAIAGLGDCFMELALESDGNGMSISKSMYLPTMSMFAPETDQGELIEYRQQSGTEPLPSDRVWTGVDMVRILHFKAPGLGRYGLVPGLGQIDPWEDMKAVVADIADASRESVLPTIHTMPPDKGEKYRNAYRDDHEDRIRDGVITNLYLAHGGKVDKLQGSPTLKPLLDNYQQLRYKMVLPGVPIYLIPGLGLQQGASKELGGAPALAYAKLINSYRSYLANQIIWAIGVEVVANRGYQYWMEQRPKVEIEWPEFIAQQVPGLQPTQQDEEEATETFVSVNGNVAKELISNF